ncbi:MAG TPA: T9SS type A sorting domain-containing protein [Ignavibacteria bacterium]|nr:T9SS type A sorting domain-containing protein [Ignavibacteria bacterium]
MSRTPEKLVKYINAKAFYFAFVVICINCCTSFGQSITWTKTYSGPYNFVEECHSLCQSTDGNFFALGFSFDSVLSLNDLVLVMKLNPYGDTIWSKIIPNLYNKTVTSSISTPDGGCIFTGNGDTAYAVRIDINGNIVWRRNYGIQSFQIFDIKKTPSNDYLLCGNIVTSTRNGLIIKVDSNGSGIWQKTYFSTFYKSFGSIEVFDNDNFILSGTISDQLIDTQQVTATKVNADGDLIWEFRYLVLGVSGNGRKITKTYNNNYIISGTTNGQTNGVSYFFKIDSNGNKLFEHKFESSKNETLWDTKILSENRYVLAMTRDSLPQLRNSRVIISDSIGNIIKDRIFRVPSSNGRIWLETILPQANGDIIFGGFSELYNDSTDFFLTRTDSLLNVPPIAISQNEIFIPSEYKVYPIYPNPFNPSAIFKFEIPESQTIKLTLYDVAGRQISVLFNEFKKYGTYEFKIDTGFLNLSSGIYFLKFQTSSGYVSTSKIVFLK